MKEKIDRLIEVEERSIQLLKTKKAPYGAIQHHKFIITYLKAIKIVKEKCLYIDEKYGTVNVKNFNVLTQEDFNLLEEVF